MATVQNSTSQTDDVLAAYRQSTSSTKKSATEEMQDRFLKLLVTQLQNQDPMNPLDNAQMTQQLAQINTVSGIEKLNTTMTQMMGLYNSTQAMQSASLLGRHVLVPGSDLALGEKGAMGGVELGAAADAVTVSIKNAAGEVVATEQLGANSAGSFAFIWDGKNSDGEALPQGNYTFEVSATQGGNKVTANALGLGTVSALVRGTNGGFQLDLGSGLVNFEDVRQIL